MTITMLLATPILAAGASLAQPVPIAPVPAMGADVDVTWEAPWAYVRGESFMVKLELKAGESGGAIASWLLSPSAFTVNGEPVIERTDDSLIPLPASGVLTLEFDLGPYLSVKEDFKIGFAQGNDKPIEVRVFQPAEEGFDFMAAEPAELGKYQVLMETNRGSILIEMWPDVAPNHVRNFLDLCSSGQYDKTLFFRVSPTFMIQGGCPKTKNRQDQREWGMGDGPRKVDAEFSDREHVAGVLSMARGTDENSASCQFFIMTAPYPSLDGKYSTFGKVLTGMDAVKRIASSKGTRGQDTTVRPNEPQEIVKTRVVMTSGGDGQ